MSKTYPIKDNKHVCSTIKYISFKSIHYVINLNVVSPSMFLKNLIMCFYLCIVSLN